MGHKGFALSLIVEALAGALSGSGCSTGQHHDYSRNGVFGLVIDPDFFGGRASFTQEISALMARLKSLEPYPKNSDGVAIPGQRSLHERSKRRQHGLPVDDITWSKLQTACEQMKVSFVAS